MKKIAVLLTALLLLLTGCGTSASNEGEDSTSNEISVSNEEAAVSQDYDRTTPSNEEAAVPQDYDRTTPAGAYGYAVQKVQQVTHMTYTLQQTTRAEVEGTSMVDHIDNTFAVRLENGRKVEYSNVFTGTTTVTGVVNQSSHSSGTGYCYNDYLYVSSNNGNIKSYQPYALNDAFTLSIDGTSISLEEMLDGAVLKGNTITASGFSITVAEIPFSIESLEITLREDGLIDTSNVLLSYYTNGYRTEIEVREKYLSYTEAEIEIPDGYEDFPEQEGTVSVKPANNVAIGVINELKQLDEGPHIAGYYILTGSSTRVYLPVSEDFSAAMPSTLLLLEMDDSRNYSISAELSPQTHPEYFLSTTARPIDKIDMDYENYTITMTIGGNKVDVDWGVLILTWDGTQWATADRDTIVSAGNYYFVYDSAGSETVRFIIQQHGTYMP